MGDLYSSPVVPLENKMTAVSSTGLMLRLDKDGSGLLVGLFTSEENDRQPGWEPFVMMA